LAIGWYLSKGEALHPQWLMLPLGAPLLLLMLGSLGLGMGLMVSSLTTKYRDLAFLVQFAVQLAMYATPVVYPLSMVPDKYRFWIELNPMTGIIETFRWLHLGTGAFNAHALGWSVCCTMGILLLGVMIFSRVEKSFMDHI
jgi:lipopolysaccharide transport system permease protein